MAGKVTSVTLDLKLQVIAKNALPFFRNSRQKATFAGKCLGTINFKRSLADSKSFLFAFSSTLKDISENKQEHYRRQEEIVTYCGYVAGMKFRGLSQKS